MKPLGAILAGGRSSRFGSDKALAWLEGEPLLAHVARQIAPCVGKTILCGRSEPLADLVPVADWPRPDLGPLGGLCGALRYAAAHAYPAVISIGCDMPLLPDQLMARLTAMEGAAYVAEAPILGLWPSALADALENHLSSGRDRSVRGWAAAVGAAPLIAGAAIPNLNRPEDMARLRTSIGAGVNASG